LKEKLTHDEVNTLIKASKLAREKGIKLGVNVKEICQQAGISRKTGYQWLKEEQESNRKKEEEFQKLVHMEVDHQKNLQEQARLKFEIEGLRLAMEIHGMDKKKDIPQKRKRKP
jgi:transposase-like protein